MLKHTQMIAYDSWSSLIIVKTNFAFYSIKTQLEAPEIDTLGGWTLREGGVHKVAMFNLLI